MDENLKKLEAQNRRLKVLNVITIIGLLVALVIVFTTNTEVMKDNKEKGDIIVEKETENNAYQSELSNTNSKLNTTRTELNDIKTEIYDIENTTRSTRTKNALRNLAKHIDTLSMITMTNNDTINVFYYKRKNDNNTITKAIKSIDFVNYEVINKTPSSNLDKKNNVVYYGKLVPKPIVDTLVKHLRTNDMNITLVRPFIMNYEYKDNALEIGYQNENKNTQQNNKYHVNLVSYKPNVKKKNKIALALTDLGYEVNVLQDLVEDTGFSFNRSTIIYHSDDRRKKAEELKKILKTQLGINFLIRKSDNTEASQPDHKDIFIIQYRGPRLQKLVNKKATQ